MKNESDPLLRVCNWGELYENNRSRELARTTCFPAPNDLSADWYVELVAHEEGAAHFGAWNAILMVASRAKVRGVLMREDGRPHTAESLARVTRLPELVMKRTIDRALQIGLLEVSGGKPRNRSNLASHPAATKPQGLASRSHKRAAEGKGMEHHHQEKKGTERESKRRERSGTEAAGGDSTTEHSDSPSDSGSSSPKKTDDDSDAEEEDADSETRYASPEDELKAIYLAKAGEPMTIDVLDAIRVNLECNRVEMSDFLVRVRRDAPNEWRNPPGFLRGLSKRFRAMTRSASAPVTAAEAEAKNYQGRICYSREPGRGVVQGPDGKLALLMREPRVHRPFARARHLCAGANVVILLRLSDIRRRCSQRTQP